MVKPQRDHGRDRPKRLEFRGVSHGDTATVMFVDARRLLGPDTTKTAPPAPARPRTNRRRNAGGFSHGWDQFGLEYWSCCTAETVQPEYMPQEVAMPHAAAIEYRYYSNTSWLHEKNFRNRGYTTSALCQDPPAYNLDRLRFSTRGPYCWAQRLRLTAHCTSPDCASRKTRYTPSSPPAGGVLQPLGSLVHQSLVGSRFQCRGALSHNSLRGLT
jgi:hypothetical protein